ncbi:MAG TPA: sugar ABC transporter permease [Feifaniaceae bacterium]|nr:sugar ABC transporter permease [Feifaniaceae bacterium]
MKNNNRKFLLAVLIPVFLQVFVFMLLPIFGTGAISFMEYNPLQQNNRFVGFQNYGALLHDGTFWVALRNTLVFTFVTVALNIVLSLTMAALISQLKSNKSRGFFRMIVFLPCMAPLVASSVVWARSIYQTRGGLANAILALFGGEAISWIGDARYLMISVVIFTIWADMGYNTVLFSAGIDGIPEDLYQAAQLDGAGRWRTFSGITLPLLGRTMTFVTLMTLISHFQMFAQFNVLAPRDGPQNSGLVLTSYIYKNAFVYKEMGYAAAISMALFLIILVVTVIQQRSSKVDWEY